MATVQTTFTWVAYAVVVVLLMLVAALFTFTYQTPRERSPAVTGVSILTLSALLATVLLVPVDIALVSSTTSSKLGRRKEWATQERVDNILLTLRIVYYFLYSLDALLCLLVVPFTYFWFEEYDDVEAEEGTQTVGSRIWGALKYTIAFFLLVVILFLIGFFLPVASDIKDRPDFDYLKDLLAENHGERALTFALGLLMTVGTILYVGYTGAGLALLPISFVKSAPAVSAPSLAADTTAALESNRERQRQLEGLLAGRSNGGSNKDQRELDALVREERTLVRRQRLANEARGEGKSWLIRAWTKVEAAFRPVKLIGGIVLMLVSIILWISMLLTGIDKASNSVCKQHCGYILGHINIFNPVNWIFVKASKVFPIDYVIVALLVLFLFSSSVKGIATIGIRFLWLRIFEIRKGHTSPQALLMATVMLTLITLALNYALATLIAPQYAMYGPQTFCTHPPRHPQDQPDCTDRPDLIRPCSEIEHSTAAKNVCTETIVSTFLNRITLNFPFFGAIDFWAQFFFLASFLIVFLVSLVRTPRIDVNQLDEDAEEEEEEGLLASTGRRFGATWQDVTGRVGRLGRNDTAAD